MRTVPSVPEPGAPTWRYSIVTLSPPDGMWPPFTAPVTTACAPAVMLLALTVSLPPNCSCRSLAAERRSCGAGIDDVQRAAGAGLHAVACSGRLALVLAEPSFAYVFAPVTSW